jgi:hypothetical protein
MGISVRRGLHGAEVGVELVEPLGPQAAMGLDPVHGGVQRLPLQVTGTELRLPTPGDQSRPLEHLQVLGDPGQAQGERLGQLVHRRVAGSEPGHDRPAGRVGERGERDVESLLERRRHDASPEAVMGYLTTPLISRQVN